MKNSRLCAVTVIMLLLLSACGGGEKSRYVTLPSEGWIYGDTIDFMMCDSDTVTLGPVDIAIVVRHTNSYKYANLWLEMQYFSPDSALHTDTIDVRLADKFGNWLGSGIGVSYQLIDTVMRRAWVDFSLPVKISHVMRTDTLTDLEQIGLVIYQQKGK